MTDREEGFSAAGGQDAVDEFDTVAGWTAAVLASKPPAARVPGACRGSGDPAALDWLAARLGVSPAVAVLDAGGGIGGPAAWMAQRSGARPTVLEPMPGAARWCRRLFGLAAVAGSAEDPPFAARSFHAAWALAVLSTARDQDRFLAGVGRVLRPGGRLGVLEYVAEHPVPDPPSGNRFVSEAELTAMLERHGFQVGELTDTSHLPDDRHRSDAAHPGDAGGGQPSAGWHELAAQTKDEVAAVHRGSEILAAADAQERRFADLLADGTLVQIALIATKH